MAIAPLVASAQTDTSTSRGGGTLSLYFENDLFAGTDRYYTNGVKAGWSTTDLEKFSDTPYASPMLPLLNAIPFLNKPEFQKNLTFTFGQNIYTPNNLQISAPQPHDRPYAGWLYGGVGIVVKDADFRSSFGLDIGMVGPASLAQEAQTVVHTIRGFPVPQGWSNQLHNEPGLVAAYELSWRWPRHERRAGLGWDFIPHTGFDVGNIYDYADLGAELRVGINLPDDFGTPNIGSTSSTPTSVEGSQQAQRVSSFDFGAYLFARVEGRAIARNIFLDGNTFENSASVPKKWDVADLSVGASVNYKNTKLTYAFVYRTEEFKGQDGGQLFGSVTATFAF